MRKWDISANTNDDVPLAFSHLWFGSHSGWRPELRALLLEAYSAGGMTRMKIDGI
jgi:hypothetical protein